MAYNFHTLGKLRRVTELSLVKTLANKYKTSCQKIYKQYSITITTKEGIYKVLQVTVKRDLKKPLEAHFGAVPLRWNKWVALDNDTGNSLVAYLTSYTVLKTNGVVTNLVEFNPAGNKTQRQNIILLSPKTVLMVLSMGKTTAETFSDVPLFQEVASYTTTIAANNDLADIYYPNPSNLKNSNYSFPIALLLQGSNIDKLNYSYYASLVARYGFVVVVPNHPRTVPQGNFERLLPEPSQINAVLSQIQAESSNPASPVSGVVNTQKLGLLGHSAGGYAGLAAIAGARLPCFCESDFSPPRQLKAAAFFGSFLKNALTQEFVRINNSGIPVALLHGTLDSINTIETAKLTYKQIQDPPKLFITINGANHYGITNVNDPSKSGFEKNTPTIAQDVAIETIARWSGLFLRASILSDKDAFDYVYFSGDVKDANVTVTKQLKSVPKAPFTTLNDFDSKSP